jgi:hypothetical protein
VRDNAGGVNQAFLSPLRHAKAGTNHLLHSRPYARYNSTENLPDSSALDTKGAPTLIRQPPLKFTQIAEARLADTRGQKTTDLTRPNIATVGYPYW